MQSKMQATWYFGFLILFSHGVLGWVGKPEGVGIPRSYLLKSSKPFSEQSCHQISGNDGGSGGLGTTGDEGEDLMWHFREDFLANVQHMFFHIQHWHQLDGSPKDIRDRQGELFYYFHRNKLARYDADRLALGLPRTVPLNFSEGARFETAYDPRFLGKPAFYKYVERYANAAFNGIGEFPKLLSLFQTEVEVTRRLLAMDNTSISLNGVEGTNLLGLTLESTASSVNPFRYDLAGVHNLGHIHIARLADIVVPQDLTNITEGTEITAMMDTSVSVRDPLFYPWHLWIDDVFRRNWEMQEPNHPTQGEFPLMWNGVGVDHLSVQGRDYSPNLLTTFMEDVNISIPITLDGRFAKESNNYCMRRLNHEEFVYNITITKESWVSAESGTVRIFMAPKYDEEGNGFNMRDQMRFFFPMDRFIVPLHPGINTIQRLSTLSTLNSGWRLENWGVNTPSDEEPECGCGWQSHMLLPRGNGRGQKFDLFVMVTDAELDKADEVDESISRCHMSTILCSPKSGKYPDRKPMGYPFNTLPFSVARNKGSEMVRDVEEYASYLTNAKVAEVVVRHRLSREEEGIGNNGVYTSPSIFIILLILLEVMWGV